MTKYPCANTTCTKETHEPNTLCDDCMRRDRLTETPELREKRERIDRWNKHKNHNRKGGKE